VTGSVHHDVPAPDVLLAGRYRLRECVGRGATAEVWAATDESLRRPVAVKLATPGSGADAAARLRSEAAAAGRITDPSIIAVYDVCGTACGEALILELVDGHSLREELDRRGRLPIPEALRMGAAVARALGVVHRAGLVHRDVKPGNILLVDDRIKLADFGIAEEVLVSGDGVRRFEGTPKYVAPEQLLGDPVDPRADLYALGAVLYEAIGGRAPFLGQDDEATARARLERPPQPLGTIRPETPPEVDHVVLGLLARDPALRPAHAAEVASTLDRLAELPPVRPQETSTDGSEPGWWIPVLVLVLVAAGCVALAIALFTRIRDDQGGTATVVPAVAEDTVDVAPDEPFLPMAAGTVRAVEAIDPFGDDEEHDDEVPALLDDDRATRWTSERYRTADFGGLKPGLGLVVRLDPTVSGLRLTGPTPGWSAAVYQADGAGTTPDTWGDPIEVVTGAGEEVVLAITPGAGDVLVWFTALAPTDEGFEVHLDGIAPLS
jgi:hypothetical protein